MLGVAFHLSLYQYLMCLLWCCAVIKPCGLGKGGQYFDETTQSCKNCAIGMFQEAWQSEPDDCVNKVAIAETKLGARRDSQRFYCEKDVPRKCFSCDKSGRYQGAEGQAMCDACPDHAERPFGSNFTSISDCKDTYMYYTSKNEHKYTYRCLHRCL